MPKEPFEFDTELEELEKDMSTIFKNIEPTPMRAEFKDELKGQLLNKIEKTQTIDKEASSTNNVISPGNGLLIASIKGFITGKGSGGSRNWKIITSVGVIILMLTTVFWGMGGFGHPKPINASEVTIKALSSDKLGIDLDTVFLLTGPEPMDEGIIRDGLILEPDFEYSLDKQAGGTEYNIIPQQELAPNTIYTMSFDTQGMGYENLSWAFQTKTDFRVIRSLPADKSSHVPVETGIELTFSHENFESQKINEYFSISPQTEGTFEKHKKTMVFVPKDLQPSTIYTITLKSGFPLSGTTETLKEDYVFSFETRPNDQMSQAFEFNMDTNLTEFSTTDTPTFHAYYNTSGVNADSTPSVHIDLYRYPGYKEFQTSLAKRDVIPSWSYFTWNRYREELNPEYKVNEYDTEFLSVDQYSHYIVFPQELEAGYYAAEFKAGDIVKQIWFQVSDLAVYLAQGEENTLFWVNDLQTKNPVPNFDVLIDSKNLAAKGDDTGTALIEEELMGTNRDYALIKSSSRELLVPLDGWTYYYSRNSPNEKDYWKYLYLDRGLYQPEDIINYWGVLSPRDKADKLPKEVTLELRGTDGPYYLGAEDSPILTQKISVKDKTYSGQIKLPVLKPGYYYIQIKMGDAILLSRGLSVETYQKPSYKLTLTQDKKAIFAGESVDFTAITSFFEGTPVNDMKLNYHIQEQNGSVTTNEKGEASILYNGFVHQDNYSSYNFVTIGVNAVLPEVGEIYSSAELYVFKSKVYLTGEAKRQENNYNLTAELSRVDLTDINNGQYISEEHFLKEPVVNTPIKASLYQEIWTKVESGKSYNFISKQVEKTYHYNYSTKHVEDFDLITDSNGAVKHTGELDPENSYYLELSAVDEDGRQFTRRVHIGGNWQNGPNNQHYFLQTTPMDGYIPGDNVLVTMMVNDRELSSASNSILFYSGQKVIDAHLVTGNPKYNFTFADEHIPNTNVYGVYFDGQNYHEAYSILVPFARDSRSLEVKIESDQQEYRPGDTVKMNVQVTDSGQPVKGAQVNLNLVDEAIFSLREQNVDLLNSLYGDYLYPIINTRKSHYHPEFRGGAESGGEGDSERKDFRDTVLFTTLQTNSNGKAEVEFVLPDNLTSWRVTYHAITDELYAGSGTHQIPVRLPFFIEMTLNNTYLEGDSPIVVLRSFGEKLQAAQQVSYTMKLTDSQGQEKSWTEKEVSFTPLDWKLPELKVGKYRLTVSAEGSGLQDVLTKEFRVVSSLQERTITNLELLQAGLEIKGSQVSPTTIIFSDYEKGQYIRGLYQLGWNNGSRLEQKLASLESKKLLQQYFPEETSYFLEGEDHDSLLLYQKPDGGISILPYGESELALSAMVASTTPELFDNRALSGYFYRIMEGEGKEDDRSMALMGLAALKEPVLLEINDYLQEKELEPGVQINLALALLDIGDGAYAQQLFQELLTIYGEDLGSVMRINVGRDQDEIIQATTQMALLASRLNQPEKNKLYQYLLENSGKDILNSVEQLQILKYNLKYMKPSPVSFTYELNGEKVNKQLENNELFKLTVLPEDLKNIKFSQVEGKVGMMSNYTLPIQGGETGNSEDLGISRSYVVNEVLTTNIDRTDLVKVVIKCTVGDKAPAGLYEIVDILPSGLTHISQPYNYFDYGKNQSIWDYPSEVNGQKLVFLTGKGKQEITYLARVVSPGEFNCEAPVLSNINNNTIYTSGSKGRIVIE